MSHVAATFEELYRVREETADERRYADETQVNIRVGPEVVAALDSLSRDLGISRTAVGKHILAAGVHEALDAADLALVIDAEGKWATIRKSAPMERFEGAAES